MFMGNLVSLSIIITWSRQQLLLTVLISPFSKMARRLVCSYGTKFNCSGRISSVKLVQDGVINPEGFYNYLTAWFNADNMMYYVSQAAFYPTPPGWAFKDVSSLCISLTAKILRVSATVVAAIA